MLCIAKNKLSEEINSNFCPLPPHPYPQNNIESSYSNVFVKKAITFCTKNRENLKSDNFYLILLSAKLI